MAMKTLHVLILFVVMLWRKISPILTVTASRKAAWMWERLVSTGLEARRLVLLCH